MNLLVLLKKLTNMLKLKDLKKIKVKNKRVLVRADFDITLDKKGNIVNDFRIKKCIPTIEYLVKKEAKVILMAHLGRPNGKKVKKLKMDLIQARLLEYLNYPILKVNNCIGKKIENLTKKMISKEILLLENLRFYKQEKENDQDFAKKLAKLGDIYVNEAFAVSHRKHASIVGVTNYLPGAAGFNLQREIKELNKVLKNPKHPFLAVIGGGKVKTKIKVIKKFLNLADKVLIGGALPNTIFAAHKKKLGKSFINKDALKLAKSLNLKNPKLQLPVDFNVSLSQNYKNQIKEMDDICKNEEVFDIGPKTVDLFLKEINKAKTIILNGPLGLIEKKPFDKAFKKILQGIAKTKAYSIIGGGDTVAFIKKINLENKFNYISTGGGAMLEYLINETLPGIKSLSESDSDRQQI